jgi:dUTP pyrophosphatase
MTIKVRQLHADARLPKRATEFDAGLDLVSVESLIIEPGQRALVSTGLAMAIPQGYAGLIWPRSGLSVKHGIDVLAGAV